MSELEKAEDRLGKYSVPFAKDSIETARANVMARTIHSESEDDHSLGFNYNRFYAAAAALAIILSLPFGIYFIGDTTVTARESSVNHTLPDGSETILAQGSSISYNSILWNFIRSTELSGEAFFSVQSGDQFTVETSFGVVKVLGTKFSVWENDDALVVQCQEGKVDVEGEILLGDDYIILSADNSQKGKWLNKQPFISKSKSDLSFENTPIQIVIESLEDKFGQDISFASQGVYRFSGNLNEDDLEISLKILTKPFGLKISSDKGGVVIFEP